jgi:tetratricopeptide (TPR) repeat protein
MSEVDAQTTAARASTLLGLGRPDDAERLVRAALRTEPNDPRLLVLLSQALLDRKVFHEAHEAAARAVSADPHDAIALSCLAAAAAGRGKYSDSLRAVDRAVELAPDWGDLHRQRAEILRAKGEPAAALVAARHARKLSPNSAEIAATLGEILAANGEHDEARSEIARALSLDPESARAHRGAGYVQLRQGGGTQSIARYREALRLDPTSTTTRHGLTIALKSRNPIYRGLLLLETWMDSLSSAARWTVRLAPLIVIRILAAAHHNPIAIGLAVAIGAVILLTWATEPICNLVLMFNRTNRALLSPRQRYATVAFVAFATLAVGCFVGATQTRWLIPYAFAFGLWALIAGMIHTVSRQRTFRILAATAVVAAAAGMTGVVFAVTGLRTAGIVLSAVLFLAVIPVGWTISLAR